MTSIFESIDKNGDGAINFEEFKAFVDSKKTVDDDCILKIMFTAVDVDKNGEINKQEFEKLAQILQSENKDSSRLGFRILFKLIDANSDNKLSYNEVVSFFEANGKPELFDYKRFFAVADADANGTIDMEEFLDYIC
ncbi:Sulfhydryl light chain [Entamoeba marina]